MQIIRPGEARQIARLFNFLHYGEVLARDAAGRQARLAPERASCRFFMTQTRQEQMHATIFRGAVLSLSPRGEASGPGIDSLRAFRRHLESRLERGDLDSSILGVQVVLEGMGEQVLSSIHLGMRERGMGLANLRRQILRQERAHHAFGRNLLRGRWSGDPARATKLAEAAAEWLRLSHRIIGDLNDLYCFFDEDPGSFADRVRDNIGSVVPATINNP